jgi:hypothetical protein
MRQRNQGFLISMTTLLCRRARSTLNTIWRPPISFVRTTRKFCKASGSILYRGYRPAKCVSLCASYREIGTSDRHCIYSTMNRRLAHGSHNPKIVVQFPAGARIFFLLYGILAGSRAHPAFLSNGYGG